MKFKSKKILQCFACLGLGAILSFSLPVHLLANEVDDNKTIQSEGIVLIGEYADKVRLYADEEYLFNVYNIGPGDVWSSRITVENDTPEIPMAIKLVSVKNDIEDDMMFNIIDSSIYINNELVFSGKYKDIQIFFVCV